MGLNGRLWGRQLRPCHGCGSFLTAHPSRVVVGAVDDVSRDIGLSLIADDVVAEIVDAAGAEGDLVELWGVVAREIRHKRVSVSRCAVTGFGEAVADAVVGPGQCAPWTVALGEEYW